MAVQRGLAALGVRREASRRACAPRRTAQLGDLVPIYEWNSDDAEEYVWREGRDLGEGVIRWRGGETLPAIEHTLSLSLSLSNIEWKYTNYVGGYIEILYSI